MKHLAACLVALTLATPTWADVDQALQRHILPGFEGFADAAQALQKTAAQDCRADAVAPAYQTTFDAWMTIADLRLGPSETGALSIAFWPDKRGFTQRSLSQFIADQDPAAFDPALYSQVSIAARGLFALEMLIFDPDFADYGPDSYSCALVRAVSVDLADQAVALDRAWQQDFAATLRSAGAPGNTTYLDQSEALRALYTQLLSGLEFTADQRLGRPMGTFQQPRPSRAEAWRSGRSLRNVLLSVDAAQALAHRLTDADLPETDAAAARIHALAERIDDPGFQNLTQPQARLHAEQLQQAVRAMQEAIEAEIGTPLGIAAGFNSQDGD